MPEHPVEASRAAVATARDRDVQPPDEQRDGPHRDALGAPDRAEALAPLGPHRHADAVAHRLARRRRARRRGSPPSPRRAARAAAVSAAIDDVDVVDPPAVAARPAPATSASSCDRVGVAAAARRSRGTACRDRAGRPGRAARRRPRARPRRRRSGRRGAARPSIATPPSTSGGVVAERMHVEAEPDPVPHVRARLSSSACASSRSSASVSLRLRRSPSTTTTVPPCGLDQRGVVGVDRRRRRARRAARRRGTPAGSAPRPGRRAARSRPRGSPSTRFTVSTTGSAGTAPSAPAATAAITAREQRRRRERAGRVVHDHDVGVVGNAARARPAPSRSASRRRPRSRTPSGASHSTSAGSTTTTPSHDSRATPTARSSTLAPPSRANCFARAEARAAPGRDDDRPGLHGASTARRRSPLLESLSRRDGRTRRRPAFVGTTDVTCSITSGPPTRSLAAVHDDHRAVVEVADALAGLLAFARQRDAHEVAGHDRRCELLREPAEVAGRHALQLGVARERSVVGEQPQLQPARERDRAWRRPRRARGPRRRARTRATTPSSSQHVSSVSSPRRARRRVTSSATSAKPCTSSSTKRGTIRSPPSTPARASGEQLAVHDHRRVDEQAVARVERLRAHERSGRQAEHLEHRDALLRRGCGSRASP